MDVATPIGGGLGTTRPTRTRNPASRGTAVPPVGGSAISRGFLFELGLNTRIWTRE